MFFFFKYGSLFKKAAFHVQHRAYINSGQYQRRSLKGCTQVLLRAARGGDVQTLY